MEDQLLTSEVPALEWLENDELQKRFESAGLADALQKPLDRQQLCNWLREHPESLQAFTLALLPEASSESPQSSSDWDSALSWVRWAMLGAPGDIHRALESLSETGSQATGACGSQWGSDDIAYRCRDCELDPTCAVCVTCFLAGDHKDHDYQMIRTGGGCCDCGDPTAWRQEGFCANHQGPSEAPELPEDFVRTAAPVLDALVSDWTKTLKGAQEEYETTPFPSMREGQLRSANEMSNAIAKELLDLSKRSEALLRFVAKHMGSDRAGLLDALMGSEQALWTESQTGVHALLYKLLGDANFKYSFSKVFLGHYPHFVEEGQGASSLLPGFSVQIFTVPTLTPRLVRDHALLDVLLATVKNLLLPTMGTDGRLEVDHASIQSQHYSRILSDLRYIFSSPPVAAFATQVRPDLARAFVHLLAFPQGMLPHTRRTGIHVEMETDSWRDAVLLESELAMLYKPLVAGAKVEHKVWDEAVRGIPQEESESKVAHADGGSEQKGLVQLSSGLLSRPPASDEAKSLAEERSKEMIMSSLAAMTSQMAHSPAASANFFAVMVGMLAEAGSPSEHARARASDAVQSEASGTPAGLSRLTGVCTTVLATWLEIDRARSEQRTEQGGPSTRGEAGVQLVRERISRVRRMRGSTERSPVGLPSLPEVAGLGNADLSSGTFVSPLESADEGSSESTSPPPFQALAESRSWPPLQYNVATQPVTFHLPLHRMLAHCFRGALEWAEERGGSESTKGFELLRSLLPEKYRGQGFPAAVMEHVLQLQVLNAQIKAGMWRRNGSGVWNLSVMYASNFWCEDSQDLDLFLLQCCAVLAPPEEFVHRIVERFDLWGYLSFAPLKHEYEPQLAEALLTLLIRISSERGLSGLDEKQLLRRELVQRLAKSDATYSTLVKALSPKLRDSRHIKEVLRGVATFNTPTGLEQGKFTLKEKCWQELDPWFLTWDRTQLQRAEERFSRATGKPAACVLLPKYTEPFGPLSRLSEVPTSGAVHDILTGVLTKFALAEAPEIVLYAALHLLALALEVSEKSGSPDRLPFLQRVADGLSPSRKMLESGRVGLVDLLIRFRKRFLEGKSGGGPEGENAAMLQGFLKRLAALNERIRAGIEKLDADVLADHKPVQSSETGPTSEADKRKQQAKSRQAAVMARMKAAQEKFAASVSESAPEEEPVQGEGATCALCREPAGGAEDSPLCHLILAQRSRVVSWARRALPDWQEGIHTEGGPASPPFSRLGGAASAFDIPPRGAIMGPGGQRIPLEGGARGGPGVLWMDGGAATGFVQVLPGQDPWVEAGVPDPAEEAQQEEETDEEEDEEWRMEEEDEEAEQFETIEDLLYEMGGGDDPDYDPDELAFEEEEHDFSDPDADDAYPTFLVGGVPQEMETDEAPQDESTEEPAEAATTSEPQQEALPREEIAQAEEVLGRTEPSTEAGQNEAGSRPTGWPERGDNSQAAAPETHEGDTWEFVENAAREARRGMLGGWGDARQQGQTREAHVLSEEERQVRNSRLADEASDRIMALRGGPGTHTAREVKEIQAEVKYADTLGEDSDEGTEVADVQWLRLVSDDESVLRGPPEAAMGALQKEFVKRAAGGRSERGFPLASVLQEDGTGVHVRACGHAIHFQCLEWYFASLWQSQLNRDLFEGANVINLELGEFLCPVCRRLANAQLPVLTSSTPSLPAKSSNPPGNKESSSAAERKQEGGTSVSGLQPVNCPPNTEDAITADIRSAVRLILDAEARTVPRGPHPFGVSFWRPTAGSEQVTPKMWEALTGFATRAGFLTHRGEGVHGLEVWEALGYTVQATETAARQVEGSPKEMEAPEGPSGNDPFPKALASPEVSAYVCQRIEALAATVSEESRSVLPPLASAAKSVRSTSLVGELFRARGMQILTAALLRGRSNDEEVKAGLSGRAMEELSAELSFWRLLADPVLFHDPFLTLVRLLYVFKGDLPDAEGLKKLIRLVHLIVLEHSSEDEDVSSFSLSGADVTYDTLQLACTRDRLASLPFLRASALLLKTLNPGSVPSFQSPQAAVTSAWARAKASPPCCDVSCDVSALVRDYVEAVVLEGDLGIFPMEDLHKSNVAAGPGDMWRRHFAAENDSWRGARSYAAEKGAQPLQLMRLPRNYHELFQRYVKARCRQCRSIPSQPVLCLLCGAFLCGNSRSACCRVSDRGECLRHAAECGAGVGVFLFLRRTNVVLLRGGRQTVWFSPYLDAHGEEDIDLRRGKPLFLSEERYAALTDLVATNGMDHDSQVLALTVRRQPHATD